MPPAKNYDNKKNINLWTNSIVLKRDSCIHSYLLYTYANTPYIYMYEYIA